MFIHLVSTGPVSITLVAERFLFADASALIREELGVVLRVRRAALPVCVVRSGEVDRKSVGTVGEIDEALARTLALVRRKPSTMPELATATSEGIVASAWSNRLAALLEMKLLVADSAGKSRRYRFVLDPAEG